MTDNITWSDSVITKTDRNTLNGHKSCVIWLTGLSGSGKSSIANALDEKLTRLGKHSYVLDGDNVRHGLCDDLGFSDSDRTENIRRIGELSKILADAGLIVISAFISPFSKDRDLARSLVPDSFVETYIDCSIGECERRDPKGLYKKARSGQIREFTGISSPYERPEAPELVINTEFRAVSDCADEIVSYLKRRAII